MPLFQASSRFLFSLPHLVHYFGLNSQYNIFKVEKRQADGKVICIVLNESWVDKTIPSSKQANGFANNRFLPSIAHKHAFHSLSF